ncbi:16501_t:CDS:2 [Racocetra fulgida]|uniref:protein-tyrosine-phosphatase n=1 Tax=Racocetra fulgida TaxID=60492 RepID=A0A9N9F8D9_9GLOM|nr:16501_t:CDS:2 [Racocetra fulgida]
MSTEFGSHLGSEKGACYRKRRLSKIPAPVIIPPPPSPTVTVSSPVSPSSDSFLELQSPRTPQSPTKRFVLRPITALTAAFQRTSITARNKSTLLKFQKSSNNSPKASKPTSPKPSPQSPKPPKSPKLLHRKGSSGSIRKRSESPTGSTANTPFLVPNASQPSPSSTKPSFLFGKSPFSLSINSPSQSSKPPSRLGKFNIRHPKSSNCRKALPISPAELAERLRDSSSRNSKIDDECSQYFDDCNKSFSCKSSKPILIDVRNLSLYQEQHIHDSFNVNLPTLLIKRYRRGNMSNFSLVSFITTPEGRDRYIDKVQDTTKFNHDVIIFDESMDENDKVSPGWTLLGVLERAMLNYHYNSSSENIDQTNDAPKGRVYWLRGGFEAFRSWDQRGEFLVTGPDVGAFSVNDNSIHNSSLMDLEGQEQPQGGAGLVRRDSLFSVNTEQNSLRRKLSDKRQESQIEENNQPTEISKDTDALKRRRPSNGEPLYLGNNYPNNGDNYPNGNNQLRAVNTDFDDNNSPNTSPPVTHPEIAFVVSTIIPNFLYLGPEISKQEEVEELESKGIKRILNMAFECSDTLGLNEKFDQYLKLDVKDSVEEDAGKSRSVTAVLAFLIESRHWTLNRAYDYVMDRRSGICPNIGFVAELMKVEEGVLGIKRNNCSNPEFDIRKREMIDMEGVEPLKTSASLS